MKNNLAYLISLFIFLAASSSSANESKTEAYSETSLGKPSVCGANFYAATTDQIHHSYTAIYGSLFIMLTKSQVATALRVNEVEGASTDVKNDHKAVPLKFAQLTVTTKNGNLSTAKMEQVYNDESPDSYSALAYDGEYIKLLTALGNGGELLVQALRDATDEKFEIVPANREFFSKTADCLKGLLSQLKDKK